MTDGERPTLARPPQLGYGGYGPSAALTPLERRRVRLMLGLVIGAGVSLFSWVHLGARWGQRREGTNALFAPATGTDFYDRVLIDLPLLAMTVVCAAVAGWTTLRVALKCWRLPWLYALSAAFFAWVAFVLACFPVWDDISP